MFTPWDLLWLFFIFSSLQPVLQKYLLAQSRRRTLTRIAVKRDATVITLIHRQETLSLLGIPLARYIDIDDSQSVLRAIRETPPGKTIEIILHTPGGLVLAASQIARALSDHDGRVVAGVAHYGMSVAALPGQHDDQTLLMADVGRKALRQVKATVTGLLQKRMDPVRAEELAEILSQGVWTHDNALMAPELEQLGLPVKVGVPAEERSLMDL